MRWSEAGYLSQFVLTHALRQASVSLIFGVRQNRTMKTIVAAAVALSASQLFGAEYLHLRNDREAAITYAIHGIVGIRRITLDSKESLSLRFPSPNQKVELVTPSGTSSGKGKVFIVEANASPEVGSILLGDFSSYPILHHVIDVSAAEAVVKIEEKK